MKIAVFCGPTLDRARIEELLPARVYPPARRGDLLRVALQEKPEAIVLIDGYFDQIQSIWHKEILWAMAQGIHVFGASSMGALRASELAAFGMIGLGEIFEAFRRGELEDDDEVAIAHGDEATSFKQVSDAMVDIRWTLAAAQRVGIVSPTTRGQIEQTAKQMQFHERSLRLALELNGKNDASIARLRDWLPTGRVEQKKADAIAALQHVRTLASDGWRPKQISFQFAETDGWVMLMQDVQNELAGSQERLQSELEEELNARGTLGRTLFGAMTRRLAEERLRVARAKLNARAVEYAVEQFRRDRALLSAESFDQWIERSAMAEEELAEFFEREAGFRTATEAFRHQLGRQLADELHALGSYRELIEAHRSKSEALLRAGLQSPTAESLGISEENLWRWFFEEHLGRKLPSSIGVYASGEGTSLDGLKMAALRHLAFSRLSSNDAPNRPR